MQVQLKQSEIVVALRQYVVAQGISLVGKSVSMEFTAGRKEAGISVEITIEDDHLPGGEHLEADSAVVANAAQAKPAIALVKEAPAPAPVAAEAPVATHAEKMAAAETPAAAPANAEVPKAKTSLFGG